MSEIGKNPALQWLQTVMQLALLAGMGWTVTTTLENSKTLAAISAQAIGRDAEMVRISNALLHLTDQIDLLKTVDTILDRRVTVIESRTK